MGRDSCWHSSSVITLTNSRECGQCQGENCCRDGGWPNKGSGLWQNCPRMTQLPRYLEKTSCRSVRQLSDSLWQPPSLIPTMAPRDDTWPSIASQAAPRSCSRRVHEGPVNILYL